MTDAFWEVPQKPETQPARLLAHRLLPGAFYGLFLGSLYALVAGTIDALILRDLPLRVDWPAVWVAVTLTGVSAAALGAISAWPADGWKGILVGALTITAWSMAQSFIRLQAVALAFLPLFLPLAVLSLPIAGVLRWMTGWHLRNLEKRGRPRLLAQAGLLLAIVGVGAFAGSWSQMPPASQEAVRKVHSLLQRTLSDPAGVALPRAFDAVSDIRSHAGVAYFLDQRPSALSPRDVDVRVSFEDGYVITCQVVSDTKLVWCGEGDQPPFSPF